MSDMPQPHDQPTIQGLSKDASSHGRDAQSKGGVSNTRLGSPLSKYETMATERLRVWNYSTPINRLPPEILGDIIRMSIEYGRYHFLRDRRRGNHNPWKLPALSICRFWRTILINLSEVWAWVHIYISKSTSLEEITTWIDRAARRPLNILVDLHEDETANRTAYRIHPMFRAVWGLVSPRPIRTLDINAGGLDVYSILPLQANFSNLETLVLSDFRHQPIVVSRATGLVLFPSHIPPKLKTLSLSQPYRKRNFALSKTNPIDLSRLENIHIATYFELIDGHNQLASCTSLKYLCWNFDSPFGAKILSMESLFSLPNLEHLVVDGAYLHEAFEVFHFPKLHTLDVPIYKPETCPSLSQMKGLTYLIIREFSDDLNPGDGRLLLSSAPNIRFLRLGGHTKPNHAGIVRALSEIIPGTMHIGRRGNLLPSRRFSSTSTLVFVRSQNLMKNGWIAFAGNHSDSPGIWSLIRRSRRRLNSESKLWDT